MAIIQSQIVINMTTTRTSFCRGEEPINTMNNLALDFGDPSYDVHEFAKGQVGYFASPELDHSFEIQVLEEQIIIFIGQLMGQIKKPITSLVHNALMKPGYYDSGTFPSLRAFGLARQNTLSFGKLVKVLFEKFRRFYNFAIGRNKKCFETKIESRASTRRKFDWLNFLLDRKAKPQIAQRIPLDRNRLDRAFNFAVLDKLINLAAYFDLVAFKQFPASLLEREGFVPFDFLELRWRGLDTAFEITKKEIVTLIDTLYNVLDRLSIQQLPEFIFRFFLELGDVLLQPVWGKTSPELSIVSPVKANNMVVNDAGNVNLLVNMFVSLVAIKPKLERLSYDHHVDQLTDFRCTYELFQKIHCPPCPRSKSESKDSAV